MNTFMISVFIRNTVAEYGIHQKGKTYKAILLRQQGPAGLPMQLSFWKEDGQWKASEMISDHALYQFGYNIDNQVLSDSLAELKTVAA